MKFDSLSFITNGNWTPAQPASYAEGCLLGRGYAEELLRAMRQTGNPTWFGAVMRQITAAGNFESVEIGFCQHFAIMLIV